MAFEFFREPTTEERRDFKPLQITEQKQNANEKFQEELTKKEIEYAKRKLPFCAKCARADFQEQIDTKIKRFTTKAGYVDFDTFKIKIPDLDEYGKPERFWQPGETIPDPRPKNPNKTTTLKKQDAMEPILSVTQDKVARQIKIGEHWDYKCKIRGCGISIFLSNEDLKNGDREHTHKPDNTIREQPKKERSSSGSSSKKHI